MLPSATPAPHRRLDPDAGPDPDPEPGVDDGVPSSAPTDPGARGRHDRGQATPLVALVVLVACGVVLLIAHLGRAADDRARAQAAADAAALAGAVDGEGAARSIAAANGAIVEVVRRDGDDAWVRVRVGRATAEARARASWSG